jgi:protoheme IX farnesyltransferase
MKIMKRQVFMLPTGKRQGYFAGYFVYGMLIIASLLPSLGYTGRLFISPVAAVVIFRCLDVVLCKLYKLRTAKAAKALMLVSVGYITYYS